MTDNLREIAASLSRNKLRTLATGFAVSSGLFLLIVLQGAGNGIIHTFEQDRDNFSFDAIHIYPGSTTIPYNGMKEGRTIRLYENDAAAATKDFPREVSYAIGELNHTATSASAGENYIASPTLKGCPPEMQAMDAVKITEGRFINKIDNDERRKSIVISDKNKKDLFKHGDTATGRHIKIDGIIYTVVGIYKDNNETNNNVLYTPYTTLRTIYGKGKEIDALHLKSLNLTTDQANEKFETDYRHNTAARHNFHPDDKSALWIWNTASQNADMNKADNILRTSLWVLGLLTLLSGAVSVSNIMLISVKERTHEFGIRKAIGATPWNIINTVVTESILITAIFGYIGMLLGVGFCEYMDIAAGSQSVDLGIYQTKYFIDPTVDINTCVKATFVIITAGALAGFFPARKAAKVKPIEALRG